MDFVLEVINNYQEFFIIGLTILAVIILFFNVLNKVEIDRMEKRYKKMMKGAAGKSIDDLLTLYTNRVDKLEGEHEELKKLYDNIDLKLKECIQKVGIVRYRAFDDVGSDLSFSVALMDENNNGFVITGLFGREDSTTYAKPLENGISRYDLTEEEKTAIKKAMGNN